jgi:formamidopyrimidine-DNA glycosylase
MPELPEVETMVRGLRPAMVGRRIQSVEVHDPSMLHGVDAAEFILRVGDSVVRSVFRRGKWVAIDLDHDKGLIVIQPRMTGGFWLIPAARPQHVRLTFRIAGSDLPVLFCDARRLGKIAWYADTVTAEAAFARSHGPDALVIEVADLKGRLARTSRPIKPTLMDQKVLAGIGNIYADETLFRARIHPERPASTLKSAEVLRIHAAIGSVLTEAIAAEGSSFDAGYRTVLGLEGGFLSINSMYGREGKPCPGCGTAVQKRKIAGLIGRPTYLCPSCQPLKPKSRSARKPA